MDPSLSKKTVIEEKPARSKEVSKRQVADIGGKQATVYEGYVGGQKYVVPAENLETMKKIVEFKAKKKLDAGYINERAPESEKEQYNRFGERIQRMHREWSSSSETSTDEKDEGEEPGQKDHDKEQREKEDEDQNDHDLQNKGDISTEDEGEKSAKKGQDEEGQKKKEEEDHYISDTEKKDHDEEHRGKEDEDQNDHDLQNKGDIATEDEGEESAQEEKDEEGQKGKDKDDHYISEYHIVEKTIEVGSEGGEESAQEEKDEEEQKEKDKDDHYISEYHIVEKTIEVGSEGGEESAQEEKDEEEQNKKEKDDHYISEYHKVEKTIEVGSDETVQEEQEKERNEKEEEDDVDNDVEIKEEISTEDEEEESVQEEEEQMEKEGYEKDHDTDNGESLTEDEGEESEKKEIPPKPEEGDYKPGQEDQVEEKEQIEDDIKEEEDGKDEYYKGNMDEISTQLIRKDSLIKENVEEQVGEGTKPTQERHEEGHLEDGPESLPSKVAKRIGFLLSGHFRKNGNPIFIVQQYEGRSPFHDKDDKYTAREAGNNVDIYVSGKYYEENILEEVNDQLKYLNTKPDKIAIDERSVIYDGKLMHTVICGNYYIVISGNYLQSRLSKEYTPFLSIRINNTYDITKENDIIKPDTWAKIPNTVYISATKNNNPFYVKKEYGTTKYFQITEQPTKSKSNEDYQTSSCLSFSSSSVSDDSYPSSEKNFKIKNAALDGDTQKTPDISNETTGNNNNSKLKKSKFKIWSWKGKKKSCETRVGLPEQLDHSDVYDQQKEPKNKKNKLQCDMKPSDRHQPDNNKKDFFGRFKTIYFSFLHC